MKFSLVKEVYKKEKIVDLDVQMWTEVKNLFPTVNEAYEKSTDDFIKEPLNEKWWLISNRWTDGVRADGKRYTGIRTLERDGRVRWDVGVNLNDNEWVCFFKSRDEIDDVLYGKNANLSEMLEMKKIGDSGKRRMWGWQIMTGDVSVSEEMQKSPLYYSEGEAETAGTLALKKFEVNEDGNTSHEILIYMKECEYPDPVLIMKMCKYFLLQEYIVKARTSLCRGCTNDTSEHDSVTGCQSSTDYNEMFFNEADPVVNTDVLTLFTLTCTLIGMGSTPGNILLRAIKAYMSRIEWVALLNQNVFDSEEPLGLLIMKTVKDLNVCKNYICNRSSTFEIPEVDTVEVEVLEVDRNSAISAGEAVRAFPFEQASKRQITSEDIQKKMKKKRMTRQK